MWNWDKKWKVEWYEDGVLKRAMEQRVAFDPWAVELYAGPELHLSCDKLQFGDALG